MPNTNEQKGFLFFATSKAMMGVNWTNTHGTINDKFYTGSVTNIAGNLYMFITSEKTVTPVPTLDIPVSGFAGDYVAFASGKNTVTIPQDYESGKLPVYFLTELLNLVRPNSFTQQSPDFDAGKTIISSMDEDTQIAMNDGEPAELPKLADFVIAFLAAVLRPQQGYSASAKDTSWYTELRNTERFPAVKKILLEVSASYHLIFYPNTRVVTSFDRDFIFNKDKTGKSYRAFESYLENYIPKSVMSDGTAPSADFEGDALFEQPEIPKKLSDSLAKGDYTAVAQFIADTHEMIKREFIKNPKEITLSVLDAIGDMENWYWGCDTEMYGRSPEVRNEWLRRITGKSEESLNFVGLSLLSRFNETAEPTRELLLKYINAVKDGFTKAPKDFDILNQGHYADIVPVGRDKDEAPKEGLTLKDIDWDSEPLPAWFNEEPTTALATVQAEIQELAETRINAINAESFSGKALALLIGIQSWYIGEWIKPDVWVIDISNKLEKCKVGGEYKQTNLTDFKHRIISKLNSLFDTLALNMKIYQKSANYVDRANKTPSQVISEFFALPDYGDIVNVTRPKVVPAVTTLDEAHCSMEEFKERIRLQNEAKDPKTLKGNHLDTIRNWANIPQQIREMAIIEKLDAQTETLLQSVVESMTSDLASLLKLLRSRR